MLNQHPVDAAVIGITYHSPNFPFLAMVISFDIAAECALEKIFINVDRSVLAFCLRDINGDNICTAILYHFDISIC